MSAASIKKGHTRTWSLRSKKNKDETRLSSLPPAKQKKMTKNVDPTRAITEDEPFQVNQSTNQYKSLSQLKFKDRFGNDITDPDLTNPTRHRWESPLETIRGFEAAIDRDEHRGSYVERTSSNAGAGYSSDTVDSVDGNSWKHNRHPQQMGYYQTTVPRGRPPSDSLHYTGRSGYSETPRSAVDGYGESEMGYGNMNRRRSPGSNVGHGYNGYNNPHPQERMGRPQRRQTYESQNYDAPPNQPYVYHNQAANGGGESPVNPGSSSSGAGSDGPGGYIREPALPPPQPSFGFRDQAMFESSQQITPFENFGPSGSGPSQMPQSMPTSPSTVRKPISLGNPAPAPAPAPAPQPEKQEEKKRKSWFKRRGSKG